MIHIVVYTLSNAISKIRNGIFNAKIRNTVLLCFFVLAQGHAFTQQNDSLQASKRSFIVVPIGYYQPETKVALGFAGGYYFKSNDLKKISSISYSAIYTFNNQFIFHVSPKIYSKDKRYYYYTDFGLNYYPDVFYGVGANTISEGSNYVSRYVKLAFQPQRFLSKYWSVGANYFLRAESYTYKEETVLSARYSPYVNPYFVQALGMVITYDSRDNLYYTEKGLFSKFSTWFSSKYFGSDYQTSYYNFDTRYYMPLTKKHIFATQFYASFVAGKAPFQFLQTIGGRDKMRGFREGAFLDNTALVLQSEYRFPIINRLRGAAFAGLAQVFDSYDYQSDKLKIAYGVGLRYRLNDARVHLRLDYGRSNYGTQGVYITATEAF